MKARGAIITGDWVSTIVWAVGLPVVLTIAAQRTAPAGGDRRLRDRDRLPRLRRGLLLRQLRAHRSPDIGGASTTDRYEWRYGRAGREGPSSGSVVGLFDASGIDFSVVAEVVALAKADAGWADFTAFDPAVRVGPSGAPEITVSMASDYCSATYTFTTQGELIDRYGTGLD